MRAIPPPAGSRVTVVEYERIIRSGALDERAKVELIDGYLVEKTGKSAEHGFASKRTIKAIEALLPAGWTWRSEQPVRIPEYDEPEPDITIVRGTDLDYEHRIPNPSDVVLVIEVSLTTLDFDHYEKLLRLCQQRHRRFLDRQPEGSPDRGLHPTAIRFIRFT